MQQSPRRHPRLAGPSAMRADESVRPAQASDILAASSVAAEPLVNFLKGPWVINPRDKVTGVLHPPRLPSGPTGVKRIPYNKEQRRRCDETEPPSEWEKRKDSRSSDRPKCHGDEEGVRLAPIEPPPCSNSEHHQDLGRHRLDEPAGLELRLAGTKQRQQRVERQKIENRADRPEYQHEFLDQPDVPRHRRGDGLLIDLIEWDRDLRHVVEQVVQQYLNWQHRQERQEQRSACHAEHVAEV